MPTAATTGQQTSRAGPRKRERVAELSGKLGRATSAIVTDYRGLTVRQLEELRGTLRTQGVEYVVVKNTLARRAADDAGVAVLRNALVGPVGLAIGYGELSAPAKLLNDYFRANRRLSMLGGIAEGQLLDGNGARALAELPPRDILLGQLAGTIESPLTTLAGALQSVPSTLASALETYVETLRSAA